MSWFILQERGRREIQIAGSNQNGCHVAQALEKGLPFLVCTHRGRTAALGDKNREYIF